jgi:trehalose 6-phosphate phosphatase
MLLQNLKAKAGDAVAVISGRELARNDQGFKPRVEAPPGHHGVERRDAQGKRHRHRFPANVLRPVAVGIKSFAASHRGLVFEDKGASVALHYRLAPQLAAAAQAKVREVAEPLGDKVEVQDGKMVVELKPAGCDKGKAIAEFMREAPFAGRVPVFLGDDVTDEFGFRVVNAMGGHTIKVGAGDTVARWRIDNPSAARAWLAAGLEARA